MIRQLYPENSLSQRPIFQEGDLYKIISLHGHTFPLYYGYYEECERQNPEIDPMPIYPDFLKEPRYTDDGFPFVTKMQDACKHYNGKTGKYNDCAECACYLHGDELIGICICPKNKQNSDKAHSNQEVSK